MTTKGMPGIVTPATFNVPETTCTSHHDRRHLDRKMRIVGKNRPARRGARSMDDPAVAQRLRIGRQPFEPRRIVALSFVVDAAMDEPSRLPPIAFLTPHPSPLDRFPVSSAPIRASAGNSSSARGPSSSHERIPKQLGPVVLAQPPREELADRERIDRCPRLGRQTKQLMLERQLAARHRHRGVDAAPRNFRTLFGRRGVRALPLAFGGKPEAQGQKSLIDRDGRLAQQLRQPPRCGPAIQLHLPEAVAPLQISDRSPCVLVRIRQRHEARRNGRTAPRPQRAGQRGGSVRLKGGRSDGSTTNR